MRSCGKWIGLAMALAILIPRGLWAQGGVTGAITGFVQDEQGAVIPNATVTVINVATATKIREVTTTGSGTFNVPLLQPGTYRLEIAASGFAKFVADTVVVRVTETTTVTATMKLGPVTQTVTVSEVATPVQLSSAATGQTIGPQTVGTLPLSTRNFLTLLTLSAGANTELFDNAALGRGQVTINVNGQRPTNNNFQLEGVNANDINLPILDNVPLPNPQAIQEFKTQTSLYDASQGRNGGGNIQVALKSGGDKYHGDGYEFDRNDRLNANDWFLNRAGRARPVLRQHQFGASFGGPVPFHNSSRWLRDSFFFLNYQGTRAASGAANGTFFSTSMPVLPADRSAANLANTFFKGVTLKDPNNPTGPRIPVTAANIDPVVLKFLNLPASKCPVFNDGRFCIPSLSGRPGFDPTTGGLNVVNLTRAGVGNFRDDQFVITLDKQLTSKDKFTARWFYSDDKTDRPLGGSGSLPFARLEPLRNRFLKVGWTRVFSSRIVNEARFGYNRFQFSLVPSEPVFLADVGATRGNASEFPAAFRINIGGAGFSLGTGVNDDRGGAFNTFFGSDDFSITVGKHLFRTGMEVSRYQLNRFNRFATRGSVTFGATQAGDSSPGISDPPALIGFQNFLLGRVTGTQGAAGIFTFFFRAADFAAYIQDDWKIHPRLTLNLGLRWEGLSVAHEQQNFLSNFRGLNDGVPGPIRIIHPAGAPKVGTPGVESCTLIECFRNEWAPRFGFAWDVFGNHSTVVRGGAGLYYQRTSNQPLLQTSGGLPFNMPISAAKFSVTTQNPFPSILPTSAFPLPNDQVVPAVVAFRDAKGADPRPQCAGTPLPLGCVETSTSLAGGPIFRSADGGPLSGNFFFPVRDFKPPYTEQWNFGVQRQMFKGWVLEVDYVGTHGNRLVGTGRPLNPGQICTIANPCIIPAEIGSSVTVPAETPFVTKNPDGTITITGSTKTNINARVPVQFLGLANSRGAFQSQEGNSIYHSLQATMSHQWSNGLYFQGAYTYSRAIDNSSGSVFQDELNGLTQYGDLFNTRGNRALADFDRTHRAVISYNYELPFAKLLHVGNHGLGKIANGWSVNGVTTFQSGTPFTLFDSGALTLQDTEGVNRTNFATLKPGISLDSVLTPGDPVDRVNNFVDFSKFVLGGNCVNSQNLVIPCEIRNSTGKLVPNPAVEGAAIGNVGRNAFRGPWQQNWDLSLIKHTKVTEQFDVEFRAEFFNVWNHPVFQNPQASGVGSVRGNLGLVNVNSQNSSVLATVTRPRIIQFALKLSF